MLREGAIGTGLCAMAAFAFYRSFTVFLVLFPAGLVAFPLYRRKELKEKRLWKLTLEFREAIWLVSGYLSAGLSVENAFIETLPELKRLYGEDAMICGEFSAIIRGIRLNKPIEPMLADFAYRSSLDDIRSFAEVFSIAKRSGGSMKDIIERTSGIIRDKTLVAEEIKNMTASRRYEQNIMNILPFAIIIYVNISTDGFLDVMYSGFAGRAVMTVCLALIAVSYIISRKILDIKV